MTGPVRPQPSPSLSRACYIEELAQWAGVAFMRHSMHATAEDAIEKLADAREKIERLRARLENCEASLYHYDDTYTSEYWLRHQRMIDWNVRATAGEAADLGRLIIANAEVAELNGRLQENQQQARQILAAVEFDGQANEAIIRALKLLGGAA
jgi:hypothetical protein